MNVCGTAVRTNQLIKGPFILLFLALLVMTGVKGRAEVSVESYQTWKNARIEEAQSQVERLQGALDSSSSKEDAPKKDGKSGGATLIGSQKNDAKLRQALLNLDIARELTVNDYFLLYLRQFRDRESFIEAAKKLTPEEVADLLLAYQKSLSGAHDALALDVPAPAAVHLRSGATTKK